MQTAVRAHRTVSPLGTLLQEQDDEWQAAGRRYFSIDSMTKIDAELEGSDFKEELDLVLGIRLEVSLGTSLDIDGSF